MRGHTGIFPTIYKAVFATSHQTSVWWDYLRSNSDTLVTQWLQDAERITRKEPSLEASIEQVSYTITVDKGRGPKCVCAILNNTSLLGPILRVQIRGGEIVSYERNDSLVLGELKPVMLQSPPSATSEYPRYYEQLIRDPGLYALCARSPSLKAWYTAAEKVGCGIPRHVLRWLWKVVNQKLTKGK